MVKKESIYKILHTLIEAHLLEDITQHKFRYSQSKLAFQRKSSIFKQILFFNKHYCYFQWKPETDRFNILGMFSAIIEIPSFQKWLKANFNGGQLFHYHVYTKYVQHELTDADLRIVETYIPTKSQQFKNLVSNTLGAGIAGSQLAKVNFETLKSVELNDIIKNLDQASNTATIFEPNNNGQGGLQMARLALFLGQPDKAKKLYEGMMQFYLERMKEADTDAKILGNKRRHNSIVQELKEHLGIDYDEIID